MAQKAARAERRLAQAGNETLWQSDNYSTNNKILIYPKQFTAGERIQQYEKNEYSSIKYAKRRSAWRSINGLLKLTKTICLMLLQKDRRNSFQNRKDWHDGDAGICFVYAEGNNALLVGSTNAGIMDEF